MKEEKGTKPKYALLGILFMVLIIFGGVVACSKKVSANSIDRSDGFILVGESFTDRKIIDQDSALNAIGDIAEYLNINDVRNEFYNFKCDVVFDNTYFKFDQLYKDIPIYGRGVTIVADEDGNSLSLTGNYLNIGDIDLSCLVDEQSALDKVLIFYDTTDGVYNEGLNIYSLNNVGAEVVWRFLVNSHNIKEYCFVSANTGEIIAQNNLHFSDTVTGQDIYGDTHTFDLIKENDSYVMRDDIRKIMVYDVNNNLYEYRTTYIDADQNIYQLRSDEETVERDGEIRFIQIDNTLPYSERIKIYESVEGFGDLDKGIIITGVTDLYSDGVKINPVNTNTRIFTNNQAVTVMSHAKDVYDFFSSVLDRTSFNHDEGSLYLICNADLGNDSGNAEAACSPYEAFLQFGSDNSLSGNVVCHEYMHTVERSISNLIYLNQSGALMEAYSDIMAEIFEDWNDNYDFDNSCDWVHNNNNTGNYMRNLSEPESTGNPSTYLGNNYINNSKEDDGGVHRNSTVISHAAYLMTIGVDEDESIESLSTREMAELFYQTLFQIPQDCNFQQFYTVLLNTANIMLRQNKLSQEQVNCVSASFSSVNIKPAAPSIYSLHEQATIYVYDVNGELYNNYTITAASFNKLQNNKASKFEITISEPFILDLPPDIYKVTIKDETRKNTVYTLTIVITESGKDILELYTDYGEYKGNNDYSEEASKENANSSAVEWDGEIPLPDKDYAFSGGIGTVDDPFLIMNAADLAMLAVNVNSGESYKSKHFLLGVNIDLMNYEWEPIGCIDGGIAKAFEGKFNGQNNSVNGLFINSVDKYQGLIGYANNSEVKNLIITVNIVGGEMCGGIIGKANSSLIENCRVFGNIFGQNENVGGIVGESVISTLTNCTNEANVGATGKYVGGITGNSNASIIEKCHNVASVNGSSYYVGGVVGSITNGPTLSEVISCSNSGEITGGMESVGGIVGNIVAGDKIVGCYNTGKIFGQSKFTGGIAGSILDGSVEHSFNKGKVHSVSQTTGGIAGWSHGTISNCFNTGSVSGESSYVGGITGTTSGNITDCYNTGSIMSAKDVVGGIIGYSFDGAIVSNCYSTGTVSGKKIVGGIAGNNHRSSLTNCISLGVTVSGGSAERVASGDFGTFDNNYSRSDQLIITDGKEIIRQSDKSNTSRGADILVDNSRDIPSFFTATMKWDNEIWDFPLNFFSIGCNLPTLKLAGVEQKPILPGVTEQNDSGDKSTRKIYKDFLQYIHDHPLEYVELMQGIDGVINIEDIEDCVYSIFDLNDDGVEELVVNFTNTYMAAQYCGVWTIGEDKDIKQMGTFGSSCVFYTNGIVKVEESHNHSNVGETVWPYTLYMLSSDRDSYINFAFGYSADKEYDVTGEAYSVEKDIDGDGIIYYFGIDGNEEPLSLEEYNTLINLHIPDEKLISLNWNKLTNEK